jgi:hypothetical protein
VLQLWMVNPNLKIRLFFLGTWFFPKVRANVGVLY